MNRCSFYDISIGYAGCWTGEMLCTSYRDHHHRYSQLLRRQQQQQQLNYLPRFYLPEMTAAVTDSSYSITNSVPLRLTHCKLRLPMHVSKVSFGENLSLATAAFPRNGNSSSDRSGGGGSNYDNGRHHVSQVRKMQPDGVRCSLPQTDEFTRAASSEKENAFKFYIGSSCNESNRDKMAAESVVTAASQRKLFPSTRILRLIPTNRSSVLSYAKRHRIPVAPQHTVKPQAGYVDPVIKCTSDFQQRLAELAVLQLETVRWEGQRKVRKKQTDS